MTLTRSRGTSRTTTPSSPAHAGRSTTVAAAKEPRPFLTRADLAREMEADMERRRANRSPAERAGEPTPAEQAEMDRLGAVVASAVAEREAAMRDVVASQHRADRRLHQGAFFAGDPASMAVIVQSPDKLASNDREAAALERYRVADHALQTASSAQTRVVHRISLACGARRLHEDQKTWKRRPDGDDRAPSFIMRLLGS